MISIKITLPLGRLQMQRNRGLDIKIKGDPLQGGIKGPPGSGKGFQGNIWGIKNSRGEKTLQSPAFYKKLNILGKPGHIREEKEI